MTALTTHVHNNYLDQETLQVIFTNSTTTQRKKFCFQQFCSLYFQKRFQERGDLFQSTLFHFLFFLVTL